MTLCDTGPLVALLDTGDKNHAASVAALPSLAKPLLTTWACLTEAMYLVGGHGGYPAQEKLWSLVENGTLRIHSHSDTERGRMHVLMQQYKDAPMDLADASLVATAESPQITRIFTTDRHFYAYRTNDKKAFTVIP
jgi:uncharacterized protein